MNKENTTAKDYLKSTDFTKEILCSKETSDKFAYYLEAYANKRVSEAIEEVTKYNTELSSENRRMDRLIDGLIKTLWTKSTK